MVKKLSKALLWKFLFPLFLLMTLFTSATGVLLWSISSDSALVITEEKVSGQVAAAAREVAIKIRDDFLSEKKLLSISLSEEDINGIALVGTRAIHRLNAQVELSQYELLGVASLFVPENPFGNYINIEILVPESYDGLSIDQISFGGVSLSGETALWLFESASNLVFGNDMGSALIAMIKKIEIKNDRLAVTYQQIPDFKQRINAFLGRVKEVRDDLDLHGNSDVVSAYYQHLCTVGNELIDYPDVSLKYYLTTLFQLAQKRTPFSEAPVEENRAGLLALSIYLGAESFGRFTGDIGQYDLDSCPKPKNVVLGERKDLNLHFIYSLGIKVLSDSGTSFVIGEVKELLDSTSGGSGFSFADLAADRAGIRLAEVSLDERYAKSVQRYFSQVKDEKHFFPSISDLPEGLSEQQFEQQYGGIEGNHYKSLVKEIDQRINRAALHLSVLVEN